jgi:hypothetical protein
MQSHVAEFSLDRVRLVQMKCAWERVEVGSVADKSGQSGIGAAVLNNTQRAPAKRMGTCQTSVFGTLIIGGPAMACQTHGGFERLHVWIPCNDCLMLPGAWKGGMPFIQATTIFCTQHPTVW